MLKWENPGNPVNQRKLHTVHTLIFAKSTKVAHGRTRVKQQKLKVNTFSLFNFFTKLENITKLILQMCCSS